MKTIIRYVFIVLFTIFYEKKYLLFLGIKKTIIYTFFQRFLRINSKARWPVHWASIVSSPEKIKLLDYKVSPGLMPGCYIQAMNGIIFGHNVIIAPGVKIVSSDHSVYNFTEHLDNDSIEIGDNCWLAANCVILPGVKLGNHTIVAAGAVVTKSFKEGNCIIGGTPARIIKNINDYS